jgi:hypothetical protein
VRGGKGGGGGGGADLGCQHNQHILSLLLLQISVLVSKGYKAFVVDKTLLQHSYLVYLLSFRGFKILMGVLPP